MNNKRIRNRIRSGLIAGIALTGLLLSGCTVDGSTSPVDGPEQVSDDTEIKIALLIPQLDNFFTLADIRGVKDYAAENNATVQVFNADFDPADQSQQCLDAITSGFHAIIVQAVTGTSIVPCAKRAISEGLAVVAIETALGEKFTYEPQVEGITGTVMADDENDGTAAGETIIKACEGKDPCIVAQLIGVEGYGFDDARGKVIARVVEDHGGIEIVSRTPTFFQIDQALAATRDILAATPEINVIETSADQMSVGARKALDEAGRDDVLIVSHGYSIEGLEALETGEHFSNGVMLPYTTGYEGARIAIDTLRGKTLSEDERFFNPVVKFGPEGGVLFKDSKYDHEPEYSIYHE